MKHAINELRAMLDNWGPQKDAEWNEDISEAIRVLGIYSKPPGNYAEHHKDMAETTVEELLENRAIEIYNSWSDQEGWVPWVERGNSEKQGEARCAARLERANRVRSALGWEPLTLGYRCDYVGVVGIDPAFGPDDKTNFSYAINGEHHPLTESEFKRAKGKTFGSVDELRAFLERGLGDIGPLTELVQGYANSDDDLGELDASAACKLDNPDCESCS